MPELDALNMENISELPDGYRMTELGPLPAEWRVVRFEEAITRRKLRVGKLKQAEYKPYGKYPIIDQGQNYIAGYTDREDLLYQGDLPVIIFGDHTRIWKFVDFPFVCGADGTKIILPNTKIFDALFLFFAFQRLDIPSRGYNRHYSLLREKSIPLPPLPEQRAIAYVLRTVQKAKEATELVIAALRELKKSLMRYLFTSGPVPLDAADRVELKDTEIGPIPAHWRVVRLGEIFEIQQGKALSPKARSGDRKRPFLRTANVLWGKIDLTVLDEMHFEPEEEQRLALLPGDLLVCEGGDIGRTAMWEGQLPLCLYQNHLHRLRPIRANSVEPAFYMYWMQAAWTLFGLYGGSANRTTIPNLSRSRLASFVVPLPPLPEQREIARILQSVDEKIQAEEKRKKALEALFKALLHYLMTAKIRLPKEFVTQFEGVNSSG